MLLRIRLKVLLCAVGLQFATVATLRAADVPNTENTASKTNQPIPWNQIGAKAGADYNGDGLCVTATETGARLHCVFQRMDGEATTEGLWLSSTVTNGLKDRFLVVAAEVTRLNSDASSKLKPQIEVRSLLTSAATDHGALPRTGKVTVDGQIVRFSRPGLTEEYSVSMDGVRQDFLVQSEECKVKNGIAGDLVVILDVTGARVEATTYGAQLVLEKSGRRIAYSRLRATDATGKELPARLEVVCNSALRTPHSPLGLALVVNDAGAVYPVRIDPTFSDANWISMGGIAGTDGEVDAAVTDGSGNIYIGGRFIVSGDVIANNIAKWNGSRWSPLGSGMGSGDFNDTEVYALALSGSTLYAGGNFKTAGGTNANYIAQWNGSSCSPLGSGMGSNASTWVSALAVSGGTLYAAGFFTTAGGNPANSIAQWNGSTWSPLGSGMNSQVRALAVSGGTLYAGGYFSTAGGTNAHYVAQWNGSNWSPLGTGMNNQVVALAASGGTLYAGGGFFSTAGGTNANYIAQWNGSTWSSLGTGMNNEVFALAVSGGTLFAGGAFTTAGGTNAGSIGQWKGSNWSSLGLGINSYLSALAASGNTLYAGGYFTRAGSNLVDYIAQWDGNSWSALGSGMNRPVFALAVSGSILSAGGDFTTAGSTNATFIAQWNGSSWSPLSSGMNAIVWAVAVSGGTLFAGGDFTTAGGTNANFIAQWNGSSWSPLGSGMNDAVYALAVSHGMLYAGGYFTTADGTNANRIAQWNGSSWSPLGSGIDGVPANVYALATSGAKLYAGGRFTIAGDKVSLSVAEAYLIAPPGGIVDSIVTPSSGIADVKFYGNPGQQFGVQRSTNLSAHAWTTVNSSPLSPAADGSVTFVDTNAPTPRAYYRVFQY